MGSRLSEDAGDIEEGGEGLEGEEGLVELCMEEELVGKVGKEGLHGEGGRCPIPPPGRGAPIAASMCSG